MSGFMRQIIIEVPVALLCMLLTGFALWKARWLGYWMAAVGVGLFVLLSWVQIQTTHGKGDSPEAKGIGIGCCFAIVGMLRAEAERRKSA